MGGDCPRPLRRIKALLRSEVLCLLPLVVDSLCVYVYYSRRCLGMNRRNTSWCLFFVYGDMWEKKSNIFIASNFKCNWWFALLELIWHLLEFAFLDFKAFFIAFFFHIWTCLEFSSKPRHTKAPVALVLASRKCWWTLAVLQPGCPVTPEFPTTSTLLPTVPLLPWVCPQPGPPDNANPQPPFVPT